MHFVFCLKEIKYCPESKASLLKVSKKIGRSGLSGSDRSCRWYGTVYEQYRYYDAVI